MSFVAKNLLTVSPSSFSPNDLPNLSHWFSSDEGLVRAVGNNFTDETRSIELAGFIGVGEANPNGTFTRQNFFTNGRYAYEGGTSNPEFGGSNKVQWNGSNWELYVVSYVNDDTFQTVTYQSTGGTDYPWQATWADGTVSPTATTFDVPATSEGDLIRAWYNKADTLNADRANQATNDQKPSLTFLTKSGTTYPAVLFGGSQVLRLSHSVPQNPPLTYYFVTVDSGGGLSRAFICQSTSTLNVRNCFQTSTGGNLALRQSTLRNSSISTGGSRVLFAVLNGGGTGSVGSRFGGTTSRETLTALGTGSAASTLGLIGALTVGGSNGIFGDFVEILVYKSAHTTTEQDQIIEYFKKRYPYIT